jgi:phenylalanyl-tRNA synthetase beta chain
MDDQSPNVPLPTPVRLRVARAARVIGMPITEVQCLDVFRRLGLPAVAQDGIVTVTPPAYRFDLRIEEDLIEEVARLVGFKNLPDTAPLAPVTPSVRSEANRGRFAVRRSLAALGYQEAITFSFVPDAWENDLAGNADPIRLLNPIASTLGVMRSSLMGSMLDVLQHNLDRKATRVRAFELGRVFCRHAATATSDTQVQGIDQPVHLAGVAHGDASGQQWGSPARAVDFYDVKGDIEALLAPRQPVFEAPPPAESHPALHPGRCARILLDGKFVGHVGELHPKWRVERGLAHAPVLFELSLDAVLRRPLAAFAGVGKQQPVLRDIAVLVDEAVSHAQLIAAVQGADTGGLLRDALLFDIYRPKEQGSARQKSLAVRLTLGGQDTPLTDAQIDAAVAAVTTALSAKLGATQRA